MNSSKKIFNLLLCLATCFATSFTLVGCETSEENDVAQAQKCYDELPESAPYTAAQNCLRFIAGVNSPEAFVIRCSIDFFSAGITSTVLLNAYASMKGQSPSVQSGILIGALAQDTPGTATVDINTAKATMADCISSNTASLISLAGISEIGTAMVGGAGSSNPATFIPFCQGAPATCHDTDVGSAAIVLSTDYCTGANSTSQICILVNSAVLTGAGDPTATGVALFNGIL